MSYKTKSYLVIDDMKVLRNIIVKSLVKFGIDKSKVFDAENGLEALKILATENIDLIISDLNMPELDGLGLLKKCKSSPKLKNIPFIMLTSEAEREKIIIARDLGVDGYLLKPVQTEQLFLRINRFFV